MTLPVTHEKTEPPTNRHGQILNDDYLSPACRFEMDEEGCISSSCCCSCHVSICRSKGADGDG